MFSCQRFFQPGWEQGSVEFSHRLSAATCLLATCYLVSLIHPALLFFMCMSVWHTQGGCHENCNTFLQCRWCTQTVSIDSLAECVSWDSHATKTTCSQQVTGLVCDVALTTQTKEASLVSLLYPSPRAAKIKCGALSTDNNLFQSKWRQRVKCYISLQNILTPKLHPEE